MALSKTRLRYTAQDRILAAIVAAAKAEPDNDLANAILTEGARIADKWGVTHAGLPDARRSAA